MGMGTRLKAEARAAAKAEGGTVQHFYKSFGISGGMARCPYFLEFTHGNRVGFAKSYISM
ncbi:MAG: hypothetical protein J6C96_03060 [Oscillospiraceae bacterium]|nr:hypothetical protein [Oscillospiraceae bacterium]